MDENQYKVFIRILGWENLSQKEGITFRRISSVPLHGKWLKIWILDARAYTVPKSKQNFSNISGLKRLGVSPITVCQKWVKPAPKAVFASLRWDDLPHPNFQLFSGASWQIVPKSSGVTWKGRGVERKICIYNLLLIFFCKSFIESILVLAWIQTQYHWLSILTAALDRYRRLVTLFGNTSERGDSNCSHKGLQKLREFGDYLQSVISVRNKFTEGLNIQIKCNFRSANLLTCFLNISACSASSDFSMNLTTSSTDHVVGGDVDPTFAELTSDKIRKNVWFHPDNTLESFRFWEDDDYEYVIFSILSIAHAWTRIILAGKRDSRRHSTTSFSENVGVARTSYQMWEVLLFCYRRGVKNFLQYK